MTLHGALSWKRKLVQVWLVCLISIAIVPNVRLVEAQSLCQVRCESATPFLRPLKALWQRTSSRMHELGKEETPKMDSHQEDGKDLTFTQFMTSLIVASNRHSQLGPLRQQLVSVVQQYQTCMRACEHQHSKRTATTLHQNSRPRMSDIGSSSLMEHGRDPVLDLIERATGLNRQKQHNNGRRTLKDGVRETWTNYLLNPVQSDAFTRDSNSHSGVSRSGDVGFPDLLESLVGNYEPENDTVGILNDIEVALEQIALLRANMVLDNNQPHTGGLEDLGVLPEETDPWTKMTESVRNLQPEYPPSLHSRYNDRMEWTKRGWGAVPWLFKANRQDHKEGHNWAKINAERHMSPASFDYIKPGSFVPIQGDNLKKRGWSTLPLSYRKTHLLRRLLQAARGDS